MSPLAQLLTVQPPQAAQKRLALALKYRHPNGENRPFQLDNRLLALLTGQGSLTTTPGNGGGGSGLTGYGSGLYGSGIYPGAPAGGYGLGGYGINGYGS